jgi:hypothetical protein
MAVAAVRRPAGAAGGVADQAIAQHLEGKRNSGPRQL